MRYARTLGFVGALGLFILLATAAPASAVEYRLQVVSLFSTAFASFLKPGELKEGASGPGLDRLEANLDGGQVSKGAVLFDRRVQPVSESLGRAYGGSRVIPAIKPGGEGAVVWDEIIWDGQPGERSVWLVSPTIRNVQELYDTALKGRGALRHYQAYGFPTNGTRATVLSLPLNFLWVQEERGTAGGTSICRAASTSRTASAVVVGVNTNTLFPDQAYLIVSQAEQPTTYKAVLVWRERAAERQAPSNQNPVNRR
jgi:hypothetical protein